MDRFVGFEANWLMLD